MKSKDVPALLVLVVVCLLVGARADAVPLSFNYQGLLTDSQGQPVADGEHSLIFKIYDVSSGPDAPLWTSDPTNVTTHAGIFTTAVSPSPAGIFDNDELWLETVVEAEPLTPRIKLLSVPFAIRAATADTVPDGSVTADKLTGDMPFTRAPYLSGVQSGFPPDWSVRIELDSVPTDPPATLAEPFTKEIDVIWQQTPGGYQSSPGSQSCSSIVLRRKISHDIAWATWAMETWAGMDRTHNIDIILTNGVDEEVCRWTGIDGWASRYTAKLADDGVPVEEVTLEFDVHKALTRTQGYTGTDRPTGVGLQRGYTSGWPAGTVFLATIGPTTYSDYVVASDSGFYTNVVIFENPNGTKSKRPGSGRTDMLTLRQCPTAAPFLVDWFNQWLQDNRNRQSMQLSIIHDVDWINVMEFLDAWPCSYTLKTADDGLPIEEFKLVYDTPSVN